MVFSRALLGSGWVPEIYKYLLNKQVCLEMCLCFSICAVVIGINSQWGHFMDYSHRDWENTSTHGSFKVSPQHMGDSPHFSEGRWHLMCRGGSDPNLCWAFLQSRVGWKGMWPLPQLDSGSSVSASTLWLPVNRSSPWNSCCLIYKWEATGHIPWGVVRIGEMMYIMPLANTMCSLHASFPFFWIIVFCI